MAEMMASAVVQAVVQEAVSRTVSLVLGKRKETTSQRHNTERLAMAISQLEFAVERTSKFPITERSLLRCRKMLEHAYIEGADLLDKHKQVLHGSHNVRNYFSVLSPAVLNTDDVRRFERFAEYAGKFVRDVESGCSLRHYTFCNPIARRLLEGKTLGYEIRQRSKLRHLFMWPLCSEGRGAEMVVSYYYQDMKMPEKNFCLELTLRLSESTDVIEIAMKCLHLLTSHFKLVTETTMRELSLLADLHDISHLHLFPWDDTHDEHRTIARKDLRPDPICCKEDGGHSPCAGSNNIEISHTFPEEVICLYVVLGSPSDEMGTSIMRDDVGSPVQLSMTFMPHTVRMVPQEESYVVLRTIGEHEGFRGVSIQQALEIASSKVANRSLMRSSMGWSGNHGSAFFVVGNLGTDTTLHTVHPKLRSAAVVGQHFFLEENMLLLKEVGLVNIEKCIRQLISKNYLS